MTNEVEEVEISMAGKERFCIVKREIAIGTASSQHVQLDPHEVFSCYLLFFAFKNIFFSGFHARNGIYH